MRYKIGCTGWSYRGWSGTFYPKNMKQVDWLQYYSKIFDITEINSTFYKIPTLSMTKRWDAATPRHFQFTAKFPSIITHQKRLDKIDAETFSFLASLAPIYDKVTALILQLPPTLSFEEARPRLDRLFEILPEDFLYPIEGRHESWFSDKAVSYMRQKRLCLVWNVVAGVKNPMPITTDYIYIRLIGDRSIPDSKFGRVSVNKDAEIKYWAQRLEKISEISLAMVLANNHFEGFGPATANSLRMHLGMHKLMWEENIQQTINLD